MTNRRKPYSLRNLPKGCSKEKADEIDEWVTKCWHAHWKEYGPSSNYKSTFLDYALRDYQELDQEEMMRIYNAVVAQTKHFKLKASAGDFVKGKGLGVWYNQGIYENEFIDESAADIAERRKTTKYCHCGEPTIGEKYSVCAKHTESHAQRLKMMQILKDIGVATPGQSLQELSESCREYLRQNGGSKKLFNQMISSRQQPEHGNR